MLAKKILKNLENGNYRIEYREKCDCSFYWYLENGEYVCDTVDNGGCFFESVLIMDDLAGEFDEVIGIGYNGVIAKFGSYYGVSLQIFCSKQDIAKRIHMYIINDPEMFRNLNELHEKRKDKALIDYFCS